MTSAVLLGSAFLIQLTFALSSSLAFFLSPQLSHRQFALPLLPLPIPGVEACSGSFCGPLRFFKTMKSSPSFHIGSFCNFRRSFVLVCLSFLLVVSPRVGGQPGSSDESPCLQPSSPCRKSQSLHGNSLIRAPHRYIDLRSVSLSAGIRLDRDQQVFADRSPVEASPLVQQAVFDSRLSSSRRHIKRKLSLGVSDSKGKNNHKAQCIFSRIAEHSLLTHALSFPSKTNF